jgi:hypothetical protein
MSMKLTARAATCCNLMRDVAKHMPNKNWQRVF